MDHKGRSVVVAGDNAAPVVHALAHAVDRGAEALDVLPGAAVVVAVREQDVLRRRIAEGLESEYPPKYRDLTSFVSGDVDDLAEKLKRLLALPRGILGEPARRAALERWSWHSVADRLLQQLQLL